MSYNFVSDGFHTGNFVANFLKANVILDGKQPFCVNRPLLWGLGATYDVHLRLIIKRVVDFLLMLIELFARCYG